MGKITNISTSADREWYTTYAERVAREFPEYDIIVNGGAWRTNEVSCSVDTEMKTIELDFYLPRYIDFDACFEYIKSYVINEENVCKITRSHS